MCVGRADPYIRYSAQVPETKEPPEGGPDLNISYVEMRYPRAPLAIGSWKEKPMSQGK